VRARAVRWLLGSALVAAAVALIPGTPAGTAWLQAAQDPRPCACTWVGREQEMEDYLRTARIAKMEDVPIGITHPKRGFFDADGPIRSFAWKQLRPGLQKGYWESYKAEIAAYELDKLLGMHMVPPTVERRIDQELGAAQQWVENVSGWDMARPASGPDPEWSKQVSRMKLFDQLAANIDRNEGNLLYDDDWHLILIDHSRAFTDRRDIKEERQPAHIDRWLWDKIESLTLEQLKAALGRWLRDKEIAAILARRERMREAITRLVAERGEANVFLR
jgi:hypothetical protein